MSASGSAGNGPEELPESIGPYRVLKLLGTGGMGEVYLAERLEPRQIVALKVVKLGMDTRSVLARFEIEREAMAMMSHTNIARMLDAGATEKGQPYFAMEYVPGLPLNKYCVRKKLGIVARLQLFLQVCDGVQHAHQKGVIHRDLKPGNILVMEQDDDPIPKIIDFGLARAVDQTRWTHTLLSQEGRFLGTLPYMSPEQADRDGLDVDTRTDIYSLGVVLYELLTGEPPFTQKELSDAGQLGMLQILREKEPPTPSKRVATGNPTTRAHAEILGLDLRALQRRVRGDLDCIALCALEKDRTRRYPSVSALAANVRRHLRNELVEPSPPGVRIRLRKWVRRHQRGVAVGLLIAASLLAMAAIWVVKQLENEELQAEALRQEQAKVTAQQQVLDAQLRTILASDPALLQGMIRQAEEDLWPLQPGLRDALASWLERAAVLASRLPDHRALLAELATDSVGDSERERALLLREQREFVSRLREFAEGGEGAMASVRRRASEIDRLEELTISGSEARRRWREEVSALRDSGKYSPDLQLEPIFGLLPLGRDPESGLWLFAHLQSGELPRRDEDNRVVVDEDTCLVFVLVPGGEFTMGFEELPEEGPEVRVRIKLFLVSKFEMTQAQWRRLSGYNPSNFKEEHEVAGGLEHPVERVNWLECIQHLRRFGMGLPTEGQWEYACRAGTTGHFFCRPTDVDQYVNLADKAARDRGAEWPEIDENLEDGHPVTAPVGSLRANPWGLHDMLGNVWEWTLNAWTEGYSGGIRDGDGYPLEALQYTEPDLGVMRGGGYSDSMAWCRASARRPLSPTNRELNTGLRPAISLVEGPQ